jgi:glycosyltransferase involved in cell wall biosynthesis
MRPVLTIAIPTFNRAFYLAILLKQLNKEIPSLLDSKAIEIIISDNASDDDTQDVVNYAIENGLEINYFRNIKNIGSDRNIAQCFNMASGNYVLIIGDDDVLIDGMLRKIIKNLINFSPSILYLRAYGYNYDFVSELPAIDGKWVSYNDIGDFLNNVGAQISLISTCVFNKQLIEPLDANLFIGSNLVQVHLALRALLSFKPALAYTGYAVACKRNNSSGYSYAEVFVKNLGSILDSYQCDRFSLDSIARFEGVLIKSHHPYYVWRSLDSKPNEISVSKKIFENRYRGRLDYFIFILPMYYLPKRLAWIWGVFSIVIGRVFSGGELRRGLYYIKNYFIHKTRKLLLFVSRSDNSAPRL